MGSGLSERGIKLRFWFQLLSSETRMNNFIAATQALCDQAASPGTSVEVRGTRYGALGDQYRLLENFDTQEVIANALRIRQEGGYDAFVLANSLDPALVALREILDIPVVSMMEVCCFTACTMGETFALIVPNDKFIPRYREIVAGYGLERRLAAIDCIQFDHTPDLNRLFVEPELGDEAVRQFVSAAQRTVEKGAEVLIAPGPPMTLLASRGIFEIEGVPVVDGFRLLVKATEVAASMHRLTGVCVSRKRLYRQPPRELLHRAAEEYAIDTLATG